MYQMTQIPNKSTRLELDASARADAACTAREVCGLRGARAAQGVYSFLDGTARAAVVPSLDCIPLPSLALAAIAIAIPRQLACFRPEWPSVRVSASRRARTL